VIQADPDNASDADSKHAPSGLSQKNYATLAKMTVTA
jgi:hypothetical protein